VSVEEGKWVAFRHMAPSKEIKTEMWSVTTPGQAFVVLGWVRWYSPWRKYIVTFAADTILEEDCLRDIANFIEKKTAERRVGWKGQKKQREIEADALLGGA